MTTKRLPLSASLAGILILAGCGGASAPAHAPEPAPAPDASEVSGGSEVPDASDVPAGDSEDRELPDATRGRALLQAYGAYGAGTGHTVVGDMQRIIADLALVVKNDLAESEFMDIVRSASEQLSVYLGTDPQFSDPESRLQKPSFDDTPPRGDGYPDSLPVELNRGRTLVQLYGAYDTDPPEVDESIIRILVDLGLVLVEDGREETLLDVAERAHRRVE